MIIILMLFFSVALNYKTSSHSLKKIYKKYKSNEHLRKLVVKHPNWKFSEFE